MNDPTGTPILVVGAGGHARACIDVIEAEGRYRIAGLVGLADEVASKVLGYDVIGADDNLAALFGRFEFALVAVGQIKTFEARLRLFTQLRDIGYRLPRVISPRGHLSSHAELGEGSIVMHGAIVNAGAVVGRNCIVNTQALIEHDSVVGDHCHISTGAILNSGVRVGTGSFVGSNAVVRQKTVIGENCLIGMGQRVLRDCPDGTVLPEKVHPK